MDGNKRDFEDGDAVAGTDDSGATADIVALADRVGGGGFEQLHLLPRQFIRFQTGPSIDPAYYMDRCRLEIYSQLRNRETVNGLLQDRLAGTPQVLRFMFEQSGGGGQMDFWKNDPAEFVAAIEDETTRTAADAVLQECAADAAKNMTVFTFGEFAFFFILHDATPVNSEQVVSIMSQLTATAAAAAASEVSA